MGIVLAMVLGTAGVLRLRRHDQRPEPEREPPSLVRMLTSDADLRAAVERAAAFEQIVADTLRTRRRRYEEMIGAAAIIDISHHHATSAGRPDGDSPLSA